jgi:hypothetical protein
MPPLRGGVALETSDATGGPSAPRPSTVRPMRRRARVLAVGGRVRVGAACVLVGCETKEGDEGGGRPGGAVNM